MFIGLNYQFPNMIYFVSFNGRPDEHSGYPNTWTYSATAYNIAIEFSD